MAQTNAITDPQTVSVSEIPGSTAQSDGNPSTADPLFASTSLEDSGQSKRPRDARLLHIILASLGVQAYQERVPLQLMDFAYRYTSSVLQDALHLNSEAYGASGSGSKNASINDLGNVTLQALRLAIASRSHYQFQSNLPKEHFQELSAERNKVGLPVIGKTTQIRLPPERYCLTGVGYGLREEWVDENEILTTWHSSLGANHLESSNGTAGGETQMQGVEKPDRTMDNEDAEMQDI